MAAGFKADDVISKLRELKLAYIQNHVGTDPAALPNHFAEVLGYATLLYDHYATVLKTYRQREAAVTKEESEKQKEINSKPNLKREERMTADEKNDRITIRLSDIRANKDYLEQEVKGATLHINGCQSLMKNWGDEAKGIR